MVDTFIANASADECVFMIFLDITVDDDSSLRSIMRTMLATGPPGVAQRFTSAARTRLCQTNARCPPNPYTLFRRQTREEPSKSTTLLFETLARARSLYGAGMGFASLGILASVIRATIGLRWEDDGDMADILAVIDADVGQAIQVSVSLVCELNHAYQELIELQGRDGRRSRKRYFRGTRECSGAKTRSKR